jgi:hypothetical protein
MHLKKELPDEFKKIKGKSYYVFSSKNRLIAEHRLYRVFQAEYGKNPEIDAILLKIKENFYNLTLKTCFMEEYHRRIRAGLMPVTEEPFKLAAPQLTQEQQAYKDELLGKIKEFLKWPLCVGYGEIEFSFIIMDFQKHPHV